MVTSLKKEIDTILYKKDNGDFLHQVFVYTRCLKHFRRFSRHFKMCLETHSYHSHVLPVKPSYLCTKTATFKDLANTKLKITILFKTL